MQTYYGINIDRCTPNSSGMRYNALTENGILKADTLAGIKELIREQISGDNRKPDKTKSGEPVRTYDNGGKTLDRYTIVFMNRKEKPGLYECVCASETGAGVLMHGSAMCGKHLGKRISFNSLPLNIQNFCNQSGEV